MRPSRKAIASVCTPCRRNSPAQARPNGDSGKVLTTAASWPNLLNDTATFASAPPTCASKRADCSSNSLLGEDSRSRISPKHRTVALMVSKIPLVAEPHPPVGGFGERLAAGYRALLAFDCHRCHAPAAECYRCQNTTGFGDLGESFTCCQIAIAIRSVQRCRQSLA